jgi:hypothetical protein
VSAASRFPVGPSCTTGQSAAADERRRSLTGRPSGSPDRLYVAMAGAPVHDVAGHPVGEPDQRLQPMRRRRGDDAEKAEESDERLFASLARDGSVHGRGGGWDERPSFSQSEGSRAIKGLTLGLWRGGRRTIPARFPLPGTSFQGGRSRQILGGSLESRRRGRTPKSNRLSPWPRLLLPMRPPAGEQERPPRKVASHLPISVGGGGRT